MVSFNNFRKQIRAIYITLIFWCLSLNSFGQSTNNLNQGNLDLNFNFGRELGFEYNYGNGVHSSHGGFFGVYSSMLDNSNKIMVGGAFSTYAGHPTFCVARMNSNGSVDKTFTCSGFIGTTVNAIQQQTDGKYLVGGYFNSIAGNSIRSVARLNSNGSYDNTFNIGSGFFQTTVAAATPGVIRTIQIQTDGKVLVGGQFLNFNGTSIGHIARLNANGTIDNTFSTGTGFYDGVSATTHVYEIILQTDGKILVVGSFTRYNGVNVNGIVRLNSDGTLDPTFNATAAFSSGYVLNCAEVQPWDGKILVGGSFTTHNGVTKNNLTRFNTDGSVDNSFNIGSGVGPTGSQVYDIKTTSSQQILLAGNFTSYNGVTTIRLARINSNGSRDSFVGLGSSNHFFTITTLSDGYFLGGTYSTLDSRPIQYAAFLNLNLTFSTTKNILIGAYGGRVNDAIVIPTSNRIVLLGSFTHFNGVAANRIVMLEADGSIVSGFNYGSGLNGEALRGVFTNNRLIIIGNFTSYNGTTRNRIVALNLDGTIDNSFSIGTGFNGNASAIIVQPDLKVIVGGSFSTYNGTSSGKIARLNTNGSLDGTFAIGTGFDASGTVWGLALDASNRIICGGSMNTFNGTTKNRLARLNSDGSLDVAFPSGSGPNDVVWEVKVNNEGKILVCGQFNAVNGITRNRVVLLNSDGSIDATFGTSADANGIVYSALVEPGTGKFIIGGAFSTIGGLTHNRIVRLNTNGTVDATFQKGNAISSTLVRYLRYTASGQILACGDFLSYHTFSTPGIVQINGCTKASNPVISGPTSFCTGTPITLTSSYATGNIWSTGATTQSISVSTPGTYMLQSNSGSCITNKVAVTITENAIPSTPSISGSASLICPSSTVTLTGPSGLPGYVWSNGATTANSTVNAAGTYTLRTLNAAGCTSAVSNSWVVSDAPAGGWLGNNTNWNDPTNWCGGVPTSTTDVQLPTTTNNFPVISGTTEVCRNLEIPSGRTLNINSAARLNLYGNITGSGNITGPLNSELRVLGSTSQALKNLSVGILRINNTAGASLGSNVVISKDLDLVNGVLTTNSYSALLLSTAETLTETANAYVNGKVRVSSKFVGTGSLNLMGVSIASGADNLDTVLIERRNEVPTFGTNQGIGYVWSIRAGNAPTAGRNVTFSWRDGITNGRNLSSMQVYRRPEGSSDWVKVGAVQDASSRSITVNTNSFSDWTVSDTEQPLPVTFGYFSGNRNQEKVTVNWSTLTEINASHFEIEASVDGKTYVKVGTVTAAGNSNSEKKYAFFDINNYSQYYRLKQVDNDGLFTYSKTINIAATNQISFEAYPNPTTGKVSIFSNKEIEIQVFNPLGKRVLTLPIKSETEVDLSCFGNGLFTLRSVSDASVFIQKVLVR